MTQETGEAAPLHGLDLRSLVTSDGRLELSLQPVDIPEPGPDQVVVRIEATPIHPSDIGLLFGAADLKTLSANGSADRPVTTAAILQGRMALMAPRFDQSMAVGNEGAGTVIRAGANARALLGKTVALAGGGMYAQYRLADASACLILPDGMAAAKGAACFVNPLTAISLLETARMEGYRGLVHTAAASTLGQMLTRLCIADGFPLVNIVRSDEQAAILRRIGAQHVIDSSSPDFITRLTDAIAETDAMVAFDAVGGGDLPSRILMAMEQALTRRATQYSRYGSATHKQVYVYGGLDPRPIVIDRSRVGMYWGVDSFMLSSFLEKIGAGRQRLEKRIRAELETTFATEYTAKLSLEEVLTPANLLVIAKRATGAKYLIVPAATSD